jgi:hypothetical protein
VGELVPWNWKLADIEVIAGDFQSMKWGGRRRRIKFRVFIWTKQRKARTLRGVGEVLNFQRVQGIQDRKRVQGKEPFDDIA